MKKEEFKKLIKESVREAIREELVSSLVEVLKEQQTPVYTPANKTGLKEELKKKMPEVDFRKKSNFKFTTENISNLVNPTPPTMHSQQGYNPGAGVNTMGEGSSLPVGEVSLDQIANLMSGK